MIDTQTKTETAQGVQSVAITCEEFRNSVDSSYPSIFTKDDVKRLIDEIEKELVSKVTTTSSASGSDDSRLKAFAEKIRDAVKSAIDDHDYDDNMEVDLDGREIRVDFDYGYLSREVSEAINNVVEEEFETEEND